ncbi:MAG: DUF4249 family protein [Methanococcaceae archaeon]
MTKIAKILLLVLFAVGFNACEEDFNPHTDFRDRYSLNLIIRGDSVRQIATIYKSYEITGFDPSSNTIDPAVLGADIKIWYGDKVYTLHDSLVNRQDTSRYKTPQHIYYTDSFIPKPGQKIEVRAELLNGKVLSSSTTIPSRLDIEASSDRVYPPPDKKTLSIYWRAQETGMYYLPKLKLYYKKRIENSFIQHSREILLIDDAGTGVPYAPDISRGTGITFSKTAIDAAFTAISENDQNKSSFTIMGGSLEVIVFDKYLSNYFSTTNGYFDNLTVRLDAVDYTNIQGGYGIFGSYIKDLIGIKFDKEYVKSFGYTPLNP